MLFLRRQSYLLLRMAKIGHFFWEIASSQTLLGQRGKIICLPGGQVNHPPCQRNIILFSPPPATCSSPSRTPEGLFELTLRPSRTLDWPLALLSNYGDTRTLPEVCRAKCPGLRRLRSPSRTTDTNLDCALFENAVVLVAPNTYLLTFLTHLEHSIEHVADLIMSMLCSFLYSIYQSYFFLFYWGPWASLGPHVRPPWQEI